MSLTDSTPDVPPVSLSSEVLPSLSEAAEQHGVRQGPALRDHEGHALAMPVLSAAEVLPAAHVQTRYRTVRRRCVRTSSVARSRRSPSIPSVILPPKSASTSTSLLMLHTDTFECTVKKISPV